MAHDLTRLEHLLYRLITAPSGVAEGLANEKSLGESGLATVIIGDERLSAEERVDIYANMYFYRILDALKEDFPATLAILGDERFHNLATGYLIDYPPSHFSITYAGARLADYVRTHPVREEFPFLADLVTMERALIDVFLAPDAKPLDAETMRAIPSEEWPTLHLRLHPAHQMLALQWNLAPILKAAGQGASLPQPEREDLATIVWRKRNTVFYRPIGAGERTAIDALVEGATFAAICEVIAGGVAEGEDPAPLINQRLASWIGDEMIVRE